MLSMSNVAVLTGLEAANKQKQDIITNLENTVSRLELEKAEQHTALMNDIAAGRAQVVELNGKYDSEVAAHGKARRTVEILEKDVADLRSEVNKLKEERMSSKDSTEKLIQELRVDFERQINERVTLEYTKGLEEGYDDCLVDHGLLVTDRLCSNPASPDESYGRISREDAAIPTVVEDPPLEGLLLGGSDLGDTFSSAPAPAEIVNLEDDPDTVMVELNKDYGRDDAQETPVQTSAQVELENVNADTRDATAQTSSQVDLTPTCDNGSQDEVIEPNVEEALSLPPLAMLPPQ